MQGVYRALREVCYMVYIWCGMYLSTCITGVYVDVNMVNEKVYRCDGNESV